VTVVASDDDDDVDLLPAAAAAVATLFEASVDEEDLEDCFLPLLDLALSYESSFLFLLFLLLSDLFVELFELLAALLLLLLLLLLLPTPLPPNPDNDDDASFDCCASLFFGK